MRKYILVVLGSPKVGKTSITGRFVDGTYCDKYEPLTGDCYWKQIEVDGNQCQLEILDMSRTDEFTAMKHLYMKNGDGFILVYSIINEESLNDLKEVRNEIIAAKDKKVAAEGHHAIPVVLVGNKCDLKEDRVVGKDAAMTMASSFNNCALIETSAKTNELIDEIFYDIIREINHQYPDTAQKKEKKENCCLI
ncbi:RAP1A (predicted) [Pycnogonum litorale]